MACLGVTSEPCSGRHFCTYVEEVSSAAAAVTHLVPVGSLGAGLVEVSRQAAVVAVLAGALRGKVAVGATEEAGHQLLKTQHTPVCPTRPEK